MSEPDIVDEILDDLKHRMQKTIESLRHELSGVRTGRASTALVEDIKAEYYGVPTPLKQMSSISVPEPRTIVIQPWDTSAIQIVEKAIQQSKLGITPANDGKVIRLVLPVLTQERRKELVKFTGKIIEKYRVSVRNIRRDANAMIKDVEKEEHIPEDEVEKTQKEIQRITDQHIDIVNECFKEKESEILEL